MWRKIYFKLLAATEGTICHIWPLSCPFVTVLKIRFDGNKRPGSTRNESRGGAAELSVVWGATVCLCSAGWSCRSPVASPYSRSAITSAFQLASTRTEPNRRLVIKHINVLAQILHSNRKGIMARGEGKYTYCKARRHYMEKNRISIYQVSTKGTHNL